VRRAAFQVQSTCTTSTYSATAQHHDGKVSKVRQHRTTPLPLRWAGNFQACPWVSCTYALPSACLMRSPSSPMQISRYSRFRTVNDRANGRRWRRNGFTGLSPWVCTTKPCSRFTSQHVCDHLGAQCVSCVMRHVRRPSGSCVESVSCLEIRSAMCFYQLLVATDAS
jgi:hypothetical protein